MTLQLQTITPRRNVLESSWVPLLQHFRGWNDHEAAVPEKESKNLENRARADSGSPDYNVSSMNIFKHLWFMLLNYVVVEIFNFDFLNEIREIVWVNSCWTFRKKNAFFV